MDSVSSVIVLAGSIASGIVLAIGLSIHIYSYFVCVKLCCRTGDGPEDETSTEKNDKANETQKELVSAEEELDDGQLPNIPITEV